MLRRRSILAAPAALALTFTPSAWTQVASPAAPGNRRAPPLMLAGTFRPGMPIEDYWVSEKFDGVRGYWDGADLWTRGGQKVQAPAWFTAGWPRQALDGELWAGRGRFAQAVSTVRSQQPQDPAWRELRFMVFDLPAEAGDFSQRLGVLRRLLPITAVPWMLPVAQTRATTQEELHALLTKTVQLGGEGLMLHRGGAPYRAERNQDLLKYKPFDDAEAEVLSVVEGRGRLAGRMGALWVRNVEGQRFRIGSGFSDAQRRDPPAVGSWISYRYNGMTSSGLPRFARFERERPDLSN